MSVLKLSLATLAIALVTAPSLAQAQGFTQLNTRRGAVAGAVLGGIIGGSNNEALAGIAIGGLAGGVAGRAIGRSQDAQYWNGYARGSGQGLYAPRTYYVPRNYGNYRVPYAPATRYYGGGIYGGGFNQGGFNGGGSYYCPNRRW